METILYAHDIDWFLDRTRALDEPVLQESIQTFIDEMKKGTIPAVAVLTHIRTRISVNNNERCILHYLYILEKVAKSGGAEVHSAILTVGFMSVFQELLIHDSEKVTFKARMMFDHCLYTSATVALFESLCRPENRVTKDNWSKVASLATQRVDLKEFQKDAKKSIAAKKQKLTQADPSMEVDSFEDFTDQCSCDICKEMFDSTRIIPYILDCGHTFCEVCIFNDKLRVNQTVKCPKCSKETNLPDGRALLKNYSLMNIAETLMNSRADPKISCKACKNKFSSSAVRVCIKEGNEMFNHILCACCVVDGGYSGADFAKYDVMMEKIREETRVEVGKLCSQVDEKRNCILEKTKQIVLLAGAIEKKLPEARIPQSVIVQADTLASKQEAEEYLEIVNDLATTLIKNCDALDEAFHNAIDTAKKQFDVLFEEAA